MPASGLAAWEAHGVNEAEFVLLVADDWQRRGIGSELLHRLVSVARDEGLDRIYGDLLAGNTGMLCVSQRLGFTLDRVSEAGMVQATLWL